MGGYDAVARPPRDTFQNRYSRVLLGVGHFKNTIVLLLRIIKEAVKIKIHCGIKATKGGEKSGSPRNSRILVVMTW